MQPAVATKAAERRDTEKPGTEHKVPETKTEEAPAEKGSVPAAERNTPVAETPGSAESGTAKTSGCGEAIHERFVRFLRRHHVLTLATVAEGVPYCSNAFYCYDKERNLLVFTSDPAYLKRFPYAALAELTLWAIRPDYMKLTDNTLGFGKKLIWNDKLESSS